MSAIAILTGNHLCHNPRVIKEASVLAGAGHDVTVLGAWFEPSLKVRDQRLMQVAPYSFIPVLDLTGSMLFDLMRRNWNRARLKAAQLAFRLFGLETVSQLGYASVELRRAAKATHADLYIAHSEAGLAAACELLGQRRLVGVDMEDWYSEDLSPEARRFRPVRMLGVMERTLLHGCSHSACPSRAMSDALVRAYACRAPEVVYNAFPWSARSRIDGRIVDRTDPVAPSVHWMSQTLGPGRGLEDLLAALPLLKNPVQLHFRGVPAAGFGNWLARRIPSEWRARVFLHDLVSNDELLSRIAEHDIGFAGELRAPASRDLTVTNKILQYLQGGLAVVASDTAGQSEVAKLAPGAVMLYASGDAAGLARTVDALLGDPARLAAAKRAALKAAEEVFSWEQCEQSLLSSIEAALK